MSGLTEFLLQNPVIGITSDVVISKRLQSYPITIRPMNGEEFAEYQKLSVKVSGTKAQIKTFDNKRWNEMVVINHVVSPNLRDASLLKDAGCSSPEQFLYKFFASGEIAALVEYISALSGFDQSVMELADEVKNS
ncbi:MAG: hypothetical protein PHE51_09675 [Eubacteriales bacterium]|nr:hypothetical protein [Eubacteriales bacterium]